MTLEHLTSPLRHNRIKLSGRHSHPGIWRLFVYIPQKIERSIPHGKFKLIPISCEDYDTLCVTEDTVLEAFINDAGDLIIRPLRDIGDYVCDGDCARCPLFGDKCDGKVVPIQNRQKE